MKLISKISALLLLASFSLSALAAIIPPTHAHVFYGARDNQWLNVYSPPSGPPTPVYMWSHSGGGTADSVREWANALKAEGISVVSWESHIHATQLPPEEEEQAQLEMWADGQAVVQWIKDHASDYNFDADNIIIGGRSRGSGASWLAAHDLDPSVKGIHMQEALPGGIWDKFDPLEFISVNSPPIKLNYIEAFGTSDAHAPKYGQRVVDRYEELGIGDRANLTANLRNSSNNEYYDLPAFCLSVIGSTPPPPPPSSDDLLKDYFESFNSKGWASDWYSVNDQFVSGSTSVYAGANQNDLESPTLNTANYTSMTIAFWYRINDIDANDNVAIAGWTAGGNYVAGEEIGDDAQDQWLKYKTTFTKSQVPALFHENFKFKIEASSIDEGEGIWIDNMEITAQ